MRLLKELAVGAIAFAIGMLLVGLIVVGLFAFAAPRAHADEGVLTMGECIARANLALDVQRSVLNGVPLENVNLQMNPPPATEEAQKWLDQFVEGFKAEIAAASKDLDPASPDNAAMVAQKVLENCAFEMGVQKKEETERQRKKHEEQSRIDDGLIRTASSGTIALDSHACADLRFDVSLIAQSKEDGETSDALVRLARRSVELGDERTDRILALIADAYKFPGRTLDWKASKLTGCK